MVCGQISMFWMQGYRSAQKSLQDTSAIKDQLVISLPVGLITTDKDGRIAFYNSAAERITGLDLAQARGKSKKEPVWAWAIVHKIIEAHEGQIKVRSTIGHGTVFSIALPLVTAKEPQAGQGLFAAGHGYAAQIPMAGQYQRT